MPLRLNPWLRARGSPLASWSSCQPLRVAAHRVSLFALRLIVSASSPCGSSCEASWSFSTFAPGLAVAGEHPLEPRQVGLVDDMDVRQRAAEECLRDAREAPP